MHQQRREVVDGVEDAELTFPEGDEGGGALRLLHCNQLSYHIKGNKLPGLVSTTTQYLRGRKRRFPRFKSKGANIMKQFEAICLHVWVLE